MQREQYDNGEKLNSDEVTIKLKKWQIPYLLGAIRLGMDVEDWCAEITFSVIGVGDIYFGRWIMSLVSIADEIKQQSGIVEENMEHGINGPIETIDELVAKYCANNNTDSLKFETNRNILKKNE